MFDPPHIGHIVLASEAAWQLGLDEVRLVVTARPPHRDAGWLAPDVRLRLVEEAVSGYPGLVASRAELDRSGPNFMVDTLSGFVDAEPDARFWLILGADQLTSFAKWNEPSRIVELARLAVAARNGLDRDALQAVADQVAPDRVAWINMPTVGVSSTLIRASIAAGEPVRHLVTPPVDDVLAALGLSIAPNPLA
jgi:nicotinate-nucleotide adenylyltransferase